MENILWTDSIFTPVIIELERTADFVDAMKHDEDTGLPVSDECLSLLGIISQAIRDRAAKLRQDEEETGQRA